MATLWTWLGARGEACASAVDRLLTARRIRGYAILFVAVGMATLVASIALGDLPRDALGHSVFPDYLNHWTGGRLLLEGQRERLYSVEAQQAVQTRLFGEHDFLAWYVAPPFVALLYLPFAMLPYLPSAAIWTVCTLILLGLSARLLRPLVPRLGERHWGMAVLVAAATQPMLELIGSGQDSALSLLIWVGGTRLALARRDALAGAVFALGLLKPQLFFVPPLLFWCLRRPRALAAWATTAGALGALSLLLVGPAGVRAWLELPLSPLYREAVQAGQAWKMQTIPSLLASLAPVRYAQQAELLGLALGLALVAALARLARGAGHPGRWQETVLWGLGGLTTLLSSPHLEVYDLVLLIPPALLLVEWRNERPVRLALVAVFLLTWTLPARHAIAMALPWPLTMLGASWSAVPLLVLWFAFARLARHRVEHCVPRIGEATDTVALAASGS